MRKIIKLRILRLSLLIMCFCYSGVMFAQSIENVDYRLEGKNIVITYDFVNCASNEKYDVSVYFKEQTGTQIIPKTISGDVKNVTCGSKSIVWNVLQDIHDLKGKWQVSLKYTVAKNDEYKAFEVKIGTQIWMNKNLDVAYFRNGEPIPEVTSSVEWQNAADKEKPAWCYLYNDPDNGIKYGKLYNWYAVKDSRGLAPNGWHIPSDEEWTKLTDNLGGKYDSDGINLIAGDKMKTTFGWEYNGTNSSGFSSLPGGQRKYDGYFVGINDGIFDCSWWSSTEKDFYLAWIRHLELTPYVYRWDYDKGYGFFVRLIKD